MRKFKIDYLIAKDLNPRLTGFYFFLENFFSIAGDLNPLLKEFYFYFEGMNSPSIKRTL
ncbi:MAG TPA: hypothetical protein P5050_06740 [Bacteroidia bacterium]|nr:hypothetical protein [Bacteroidia bacterium]HRS58903.1 hypothetical protein [Bacteroidia bacterium]